MKPFLLYDPKLDMVVGEGVVFSDGLVATRARAEHSDKLPMQQFWPSKDWLEVALPDLKVSWVNQ